MLDGSDDTEGQGLAQRCEAQGEALDAAGWHASAGLLHAGAGLLRGLSMAEVADPGTTVADLARRARLHAERRRRDHPEAGRALDDLSGALARLDGGRPTG